MARNEGATEKKRIKRAGLILNTYHIHIKGRVQGVGFRPFVYNLARSSKIYGWVCNATDGVHIRFSSSSKLAKQFFQDCIEKKPVQAVITHSAMKMVESELFTDFQIKESHNSKLDLNITPDFGICANCLKELKDETDHRYRYAFITCTHCGPRFSILHGLPYDRPMTSMNSFDMCPDCQKEYSDPTNRRYFSQTNSCKSCGIRLSLSTPNGDLSNELGQDEILDLVVQKLNKGRVIAVKGIGGYLLLCDALSSEAVQKLRERKRRPSKPFAVLYQDIETVEKEFTLCDEEKKALESIESPIVLLKPTFQNTLPMDAIAPGLNRIGVMIPYAPLLKILASEFNGPLIATSANLSGAPIVHGENESRLHDLADYILSNNRRIIFPQDDSVMHFSNFSKRKTILRRSRGLSPGIFTSSATPSIDTVALGAEMKGSFALSHGNNTYLSQYLGNLSHYDNQVQFERILQDFMSVTKTVPQKIAIDRHPGYYAHKLGKSLAKEHNIPWVEVQHHEAHFAAVLAENQLMENDHILGVIWDGTGLGTDDQVWGGEFFDYSEQKIKRISHLNYYHNLANDRMAQDNRLCALSLAGPENRHHLRGSFNEIEWGYYNKILEDPGLQTSSVGRIFDAIAYLSGLSTSNQYEGYAAMLLEQHSGQIFKKSRYVQPYSFELKNNQVFLSQTMEEIFFDRKKGSEVIGARFHLTLVHIIKDIALQGGYEKIAFSGGVFQNGLLIDLLIDQLRPEFQLYFHKELSPNDESIAFGQLAYVGYIKQKKNKNFKTQEQCV